MNSFGIGQHKVFLEATNAFGRTGIDSVSFEIVELPEPVVLNQVEATTSGNRLDWSRFDGGDFQAYYIYRLIGPDTFEVIDSLLDNSIVSYMDRNVAFGNDFTYRIGVRDTASLESFSNESVVTAGLEIETNGAISSLSYDSNNDRLLALDASNFELLVIDPNSRTIENRVSTGGRPSDFAISADGTQIFVSRESSNGILVIEQESLSVTDTIFITSVSSIDAIESLADNFLGIVDRFDQFYSVTITESEVTARIVNFRAGLLQITPDRQKLLTLRSFFSSDISVYDISEGEVSLNQQGRINTNTFFSGFAINGDGEAFVYGGNKILTNNISSNLGSFNDAIYALNQNGSIAMGTNGVYGGNTFLRIREAPVNSDVMAVDYATETFYLYDERTSRIYPYNPN